MPGGNVEAQVGEAGWKWPRLPEEKAQEAASESAASGSKSCASFRVRDLHHMFHGGGLIAARAVGYHALLVFGFGIFSSALNSMHAVLDSNTGRVCKS